MIKSMTGFGKGEIKFPGGCIIVEIKTVNHKFFDATLKLPDDIMPFEEKIKEVLQKRINRGKVNVSMLYGCATPREEFITINHRLAKSYHNELLKLKKHLNLSKDIGIQDIITLPGVLKSELAAKDLSGIWPKVQKALKKALDKLIADREKEGKAIRKDLVARADRIGRMLSTISKRSSINAEEYRKRFAARIKDITNGREIDKGRLEMEVAIFAKNSDISEEIMRIKSHLANFKKTVSGNGEVGKKVDFIAQELHREINTIGSKASDFKIAQNVIEVKSEIEKIREQAKNIE